MNQRNDALPAAAASNEAPARPGAVRRFLDAWRRWERRMDYGAQDYALDRIGQLENRVLVLERARDATRRLPRAPDAPDGMTRAAMTRDGIDERTT